MAELELLTRPKTEIARVAVILKLSRESVAVMLIEDGHVEC